MEEEGHQIISWTGNRKVWLKGALPGTYPSSIQTIRSEEAVRLVCDIVLVLTFDLSLCLSWAERPSRLERSLAKEKKRWWWRWWWWWWWWCWCEANAIAIDNAHAAAAGRGRGGRDGADGGGDDWMQREILNSTVMMILIGIVAFNFDPSDLGWWLVSSFNEGVCCFVWLCDVFSWSHCRVSCGFWGVFFRPPQTNMTLENPHVQLGWIFHCHVSFFLGNSPNSFSYRVLISNIRFWFVLGRWGCRARCRRRCYKKRIS